MAHFAQVSNGTVQTVIVVSNDDCGGGTFPASESIGQAFIASIGLGGEWRQTSYNNNFRGKYAGSGMTYDADVDVFIAAKPIASWVLVFRYDRQPPRPMPTDGKMYHWNEPTLGWV